MASSISSLTVRPRKLLRSIVTESFEEFCREFWYEVIPEDPIWNWHIPYLCNELQVLVERVIAKKHKHHDLIVNVPPGSTKSTLCSVMLPAWVWTRLPSFRTICGSYSHPIALDLSRKSRDVVRSEKYRGLFPEIELRADQDTKTYFANTRGGTRYSVGIGGSVTGMHAHLIMVDDPLNPNMAVSEVELANANDWMTMTLPSRRIDRRIVPLVIIMQRLHQEDPSGKRLENEGMGRVKHIRLPATDEYEIKPVRLAKNYKDGLFDPVRLPRKVLKQAEATNMYSYAGQYGQDPIPLGGLMFKTDRIVLDEPNGIVSRVRYWDKAATKDAGAYTVGVLMGVTKEYEYWVLDVVRGQWDTSERESIIRQTAELDGVGVRVGVEQEPGSSGKDAALATIRNLRGFRVFSDRPTGDKTTRAEPFSTQVNGGNVRVAKGRPWVKSYIDELRLFNSAAKYKDQVDASSGAFAMLAQPPIVLGSLRRKGG